MVMGPRCINHMPIMSNVTVFFFIFLILIVQEVPTKLIRVTCDARRV